MKTRKAMRLFVSGVLLLPLAAYGILFYVAIPLSMILLVLGIREYYLATDALANEISDLKTENLKLKVQLAALDAITKGLK